MTKVLAYNAVLLLNTIFLVLHVPDKVTYGLYFFARLISNGRTK